jgi:hypothetical protein
MADTLARLSAVLAARGIEVFAITDHSGKARDVGLELRDTKLVIFGSPSATVIEAAPLAALDMPLRVVVWEDGYQTRVSYPAPAPSHAGMPSMENWRTHWPASTRSSARSSTARTDGRYHGLRSSSVAPRTAFGRVRQINTRLLWARWELRSGGVLDDQRRSRWETRTQLAIGWEKE